MSALRHLRRLGLVNNRLRHAQDVRQKHELLLAGLSDLNVAITASSELDSSYRAAISNSRQAAELPREGK
ncbi:MAG: hypothetical protein EXR28_14900 [Betaproteobacteria bacterium]|nr:hypothetical protein [Betaproteobacteria bacterium]